MVKFGSSSSDSFAWRFSGMSLSQRFAIAVSVVMTLSGIVVGVVVNTIISSSVISNTAASTAIFVDGFVHPFVDGLDEESIATMTEMFETSALGRRIVSVKLWRPDGSIAYATDPELVGRSFPASQSLARAFSGELVAELDELDELESAGERRMGISLLEVYSPIRDPWSGEITGVAEFYEDATVLSETLRRARLTVLLVTVATTLVIGATLLGFVHTANRTIDRQRHDLDARTREAERVSEVNRQLRLRIQRAAARGVELNERYARRISADLHDGPSQLISFVALRISSLKNIPPTLQAECELIKETLDEAMREIRNVCSGLSLPEIGNLNLAAVVQRAVDSHERRTGTKVELRIGEVWDSADAAVKICVYRFVQEGLNNAFRHAQGRNQSIEFTTRDGELFLKLRNGPSTRPATYYSDRPLGLIGLRERIEVLGGTFGFSSEEGGEFEIWMSLPSTAGENDV